MSIIIETNENEYLYMINDDQVKTTGFFEDAKRFDSQIEAWHDLKRARKLSSDKLENAVLVRGL